MKLRIVKLGGSVLATKKDKEKCVKKINLKKGEKIIIVVSAMGRSGFPYATDSLFNLVKNVNNCELDRLLSSGEIISSITFSSYLNELGYKAISLSYLQIGINVNKSENEVSYVLDKYYYEKYFKMYDILIVPGFIGKDENNEVITLGRGNSDLTSLLLSDLFKLKEVTLLKDVDGVYPFMMHPISNYKPYENISFLDMELLISSGVNIVSKDALIYAKTHNINIKVEPYDNQNKGTLISKFESNNKIVGFFIKQKTFDLISNYPCLIKEEMQKLFLSKHLIIKKDYIKDSHYYFILDSSQLMYAKRLIIDKYFKEFIV